MEVAFGLPAEADAGLVEYGIVPIFSERDQNSVVDNGFNWNGFYYDLNGHVNGIRFPGINIPENC